MEKEPQKEGENCTITDEAQQSTPQCPKLISIGKPLMEIENILAEYSIFDRRRIIKGALIAFTPKEWGLVRDDITFRMI